MFQPRSTLPGRLATSAVAALGLWAVAAPALAVSGEELIRKAESECLDAASSKGWNRELARVVSSRQLDADKVEVVFDLTKDGVNTARLTCPYSVSQGVGVFGGLPDLGAVTALPRDVGLPVRRGRAWWLLLPLGLALVSWAALRGRREEVGAAYGARARSFFAEANARDGDVEVHELAELTSPVLRRFRNGESIHLTGHRRGDWLEVVNGGWVRDPDLRYDRNTVLIG